uniref:Uncharacterized protein n=1 Tax=Anopheles dirus TaxID=7168 RepID=A0A182NXQ3_9DIPT
MKVTFLYGINCHWLACIRSVNSLVTLIEFGISSPLSPY